MDKFQTENEVFVEFLKWIDSASDVSKTDCVNHIGCFTGLVNFARYLAMYELYKKVGSLPGDLIEVGVWKGQMLLFLAKLLSIFEPHNYSRVIGCDLFDDEGMKPGTNDPGFDSTGAYGANWNFVSQLIKRQNIKNVDLERLDCSKDLPDYFVRNPHQYFRLAFLDCGVYDVVKHSIANILPRMVPGGILVLDQFSMQGAPGEANAVMELLSDRKFHTLPWTRSPNLFIVK